MIFKEFKLKDVFFLSFNISITWKGFESVVKRLQKVNPTIYEAFFLCDRDSKSYSDKQIEEKYSQLSKIIEKALMVNKQNIYYLKYKNRGQKFEDFLASHFLVKNIYKGYKKTDKNLYLKTMGRKGKIWKL